MKRKKRRRLGLFFLLGLGLLLGIFIGGVIVAHPSSSERVVIRMDDHGLRSELVLPPQMAELPELPELPEMPPLPELPEMRVVPEIREIEIRSAPQIRQVEVIRTTPTLFQWFRVMSNSVGGFTLIGLGIWMLVKQRREQSEKVSEA